MTQPIKPQCPALKPGCRLSAATSEESLLLIPEGALRLQGPSRRILELCDGQRCLTDVIAELCREFPAAQPALIAGEVTDFLDRLREKGAIEFL